MKKFITAIPLQYGKDLQKIIYEDVGSGKLKNDEKTAFPIMSVMKNYVEAGEKIDIIPIIYQSANAESNYPKFLAELKELSEKMNFSYDEPVPLNTPFSEDKNLHCNLFKNLIGRFEEDDDLYACITYGNKPLPIVIFTALNYAKIALYDDVSVICYGQLPDHQAADANGKIFDVTPLFYLNALVENAAEGSNPQTLINTLLNLGQKGEDDHGQEQD